MKWTWIFGYIQRVVITFEAETSLVVVTVGGVRKLLNFKEETH